MELSAKHPGLASSEARKRLKEFGPNEIVRIKKTSPIFEFLGLFTNPLLAILVAAAVITGILGDAVDAGIIIVIVFASAILNFANTYKSRKAAEELKKKVMITAAVIRDGKEIELPLAALVPGDTTVIRSGDLIPADGEVVEAKDFFVNESSLTGESFPAEKTAGDQVFMGSSAVSGHASVVIRATGAKTKFSRIAEALAGKAERTEFDRGIREFSALIMKITFALVIFIFFTNALLKQNVLESFLFAAALAVGLTPELLPMIIALNLSKGSLAMSRRGVIVKKLSAIQNFGSMDVLCADKTGTLTEDKIALVRYMDGKGQPSERVLLYAYLSSSFGTGFHNPLDAAIREFKRFDISGYQKTDEIPFDYVRKRDSVAVEANGKRLLIAKGAPEEILKICPRYGEKNEPLDAALEKTIRAEYETLSADGFRVLGVAIKEIRAEKPAYSKEEEREMTFLGFVAFLDPPKKTAAEALKKLERHGIEIKILTGDNETVTGKIARDLGLPVKGALLGSEIEHLTDDELRAKAVSTTVFARVSPDQKERIIRVLKTSGHVVGYLGDGINDAPPLKAADVGISVNNAVDIAKDTADLILLKKSLNDLVEGVAEGRKTFANTLKYLMMALSSNFGNMFSMAGASLILPFLPMLPTQILFNNLLYDASQFAIPLDRVDPDYFAAPRKLRVPFIRKFMIVFGPLSSLFDFATFFFLAVVFRMAGSPFQTGWFMESIITQTFVVHVIRTKRIPFIESAPGGYLLASTLAAAAIGWGIVYTPLGALLGFTPLGILPVLAILGITAAYLLVIEAVKRWFYKTVLDS